MTRAKLPEGMASQGAGCGAESLRIIVFAWRGTYNATHRRDIGDLARLRVPFGQHVKNSAPGFRIDARVRVSVDGTSDGRHQILGRIHPVA